MIKTKVAFWRAGFFPANQSNLKSFQKDLIGWKNAGPQKGLGLGTNLFVKVPRPGDS